MYEIILNGICCPIIVTLITIYITHIVEKKNILKKQFYIRFYDLYMKTHRGRAYNFGDLEEKEQIAFIDLITENQKNVRGLLANLFYVFLVSLPFKNEDTIEMNETNKIFNEITEIVLENIKTKDKITAIERRKFNKRAKTRNENDREVFYIKSIDKKGNIKLYEE